MSFKYHSNGDSFIIDGYNQAPTYASFFPALAGLHGKPMWVFTTNRGQSIAGFGINDKNGAMLEFLPANKAYQSTSILGFRTFLKSSNKNKPFYEPFSPQNSDSQQSMITRPYELELVDRNTSFGVEVRVVYFGLPNESVPGLVRHVTFKNISNKSVTWDAIDGLPRVVPFGMNDFLVKNMSRTIEAFAETLNADKGVPVFKLKIVPDDRPNIEWLNSGFFACGFSDGATLPVVVDPRVVFGSDTSFLNPVEFLSKKKLSLKNQLTSNIMPSCLFSGALNLKPKESCTWTTYYGFAEKIDYATVFADLVKEKKSFVTSKRDEMKETYTTLINHLGLKTGNDSFNTYGQVSFMDNVLRGGLPMSFGNKGPFVHVFSRKHGDMERDYNNFQVSATYYSQGNGNFRDVNQNRRNDLLIDPRVGSENLEFFFNMIQLDGYNPLVINPIRFVVPADFLHKLELVVTDICRRKFEQLRKTPALAGQIYEFVKTFSPDPLNVDNVFRDAIGICKPEYSVKHGEGYWVDHWIYNLDHLDQYLTVFPEKKQWLFFENDQFTYYDSDHYVRSRREKYVVTKEGHLRQYGAVQVNEQKKKLIESRAKDPHFVRIDHGKGAIYKTTLFVKLLNLVAIKTSALDPYGVGLEMDADKPGWCDALNGAPGLFGSSTHEMFELHRLVKRMISDVVPASPHKTAEVPQEIYTLVREVLNALSAADNKDFRPTWDKLVNAREGFREKTVLGISGKMRAIRMDDVKEFLKLVSKTLSRAEALAMDPKTQLPTSYFTYWIDAKGLDDGWRQHLAKLPWTQHRVPAFLEGTVHAMKMADSPAQAKKLYNTIRTSELRDKKLGMYKLNSSLKGEPAELGRINAFAPGWLENESIFLHMHYKFLLEVLRGGLTAEFLKEAKTGLIPFQDPKVYGRPIFENSSFIASSAFPHVSDHGRGFVARLSGATSEMMSMLYHLFFGEKLFQETKEGICFCPQPSLPKEWFSKTDQIDLGKNCASLKIFGVPIIYQNPKKKNTFGPGSVKPVEFEWIADGRFHQSKGRILPEEPSLRLREGRLENLSILLG